ncbi:hypothetical protein MMC25_001105 [Agyrium rufum]|nr:hypothetical protein [Agyrium rufum]
MRKESIPNGDGIKMKLVHFSNEFPHHDLQDLYRKLHSHSKGKQHHILADFIDEATCALKEEIAKLPSALKALIPPFETIMTFADYADLRKGPLGGSVEGVLLCLLEIGTVIGYYEDRPEDYSFQAANSCLIGMGMGLLASAAIGLSRTLAEIPRVGAEVIRIAFRLGVLVNEVSQNLEPRDPEGNPESWAYVVAETTEAQVQHELDSIQKKATPESGKIFISAAGRTSVTVSGPPSRLKSMFRTSEFFRYSKHVIIPVYGGLCHAPHIYGEHHVEEIVRTPTIQALDRSLLVPIISTSTGRQYSCSGAMELFEKIITELITTAIRWDVVIDGVLSKANDLGASSCRLLVFHASQPVQDLVSAMRSKRQYFDVAVEDILPWITKSAEEKSAPRGTMQSKIAIVGMACRFPGGADTTEKYWQILEEGRDVHKKVPADRFDVDSHTDSTGKTINASLTPYGCFVDDPGLFDAGFFNMSPREAQQTDPMQRLALVTAYEALERSGYVGNRTASTLLNRIGTFYGQASDDYREVNSNQEIGTYFITGGCRAFGPGRINYFFKFGGPSFNCDTACSSSLATIQIACTSLWAGDADMVVAGGLNILTNSDAFAGLSYGHFLSKTGSCKTWDSEADGYCRADGVGSIVLKRLEDAEADNDNILGVVLAAATNHSADAVSITHPHAGAQADLYTQVVNRAGVDPNDVSFVELHGTGTQAGDSVEMKSITSVFAPLTKRRNAKQPLHIGAVKSNVGHGEAAAGVMALIKVLCMLQKEAIPPHIGIKNGINPAFTKDFDKRNLNIPFQKVPWPRVPGKKRIAVVNNFSAAGGNTTLCLEEGPIRGIMGSDPRVAQVIGISAKSKVSLKNNIARLITYVEENPELSLADLSYTLMSRKVHQNFRTAVAVSDTRQIKKLLTPFMTSSDTQRPIPNNVPTVAFTFTGQGAFYQNMAKELYRDFPLFRSQLVHLDSLVKVQGFPSVIPAIDGSSPEGHNFPPITTQLTLTCVEIALAKMWEALGVKPDVVIGASLGEYAALHVAGVLSASDTIFLVGERAKCLEKACTMGSHLMMAVRGDLSEIKKSASSKPYELACLNAERDWVFCGTRDDMDDLCDTLQRDGHKCFKLDVPYAFHCSQMDAMLDEFEEIASRVEYKPLNIPVISPLLGKVIFDDKTVNAKYMRRATREAVNFVGSLKAANELATVDNKTVWIEIGPHPITCGFIRNSLPAVSIAVPSLKRDEDNWETMASTMSVLHCGGVNLDWYEYSRAFEGAHTLLDLPTYAWNDKNYWLMYNGDWNLTKGNESGNKPTAQIMAPPSVVKSSLRTSSIHQVIEEEFNDGIGKVVVQSDLMHADMLGAVRGHTMNGCGVATSSIHADIAFTLGEYLYKRLKPETSKVHMNMSNLEVSKGLVAQKNPNTPQLIQISAIADLALGFAELRWFRVEADGQLSEMFASAYIEYGDSSLWLAEWARSAHLVAGRIETLKRMAKEGAANKLSKNLTYRLFNNLVDYSEKYRGMQTVILNGFEAMAEVELSQETGGNWTVPPNYTDSVAHLAGFIMNASDVIDTKNNFCVTPGWGSMRFTQPMIPGAKYTSYVKMLPTGEPGHYEGDVYILEGETIVGMVGSIRFRQYPRILLSKFFSAPDGPANMSTAKHTASPGSKQVSFSQSQKEAVQFKPKPNTSLTAPVSKTKPTSTLQTATPAPPTETKPMMNGIPKTEEKPHTNSVRQASEPVLTPAAPDESATSTLDDDSIVSRALRLVANEAAIEASTLTDDAAFSSLGIDSLMSLVIAEKFREELQIEVQGSLFLNCPTIGDLKTWLIEYC